MGRTRKMHTLNFLFIKYVYMCECVHMNADTWGGQVSRGANTVPGSMLRSLEPSIGFVRLSLCRSGWPQACRTPRLGLSRTETTSTRHSKPLFRHNMWIVAGPQ